MVIIAPTLHSCSFSETKTVLLHLLQTPSKVMSSMQSSVALVMDQLLVVVVMCTFVTMLKLVNHPAILDIHINSPVIMSMAVNKQRTFLLVSTNS